MKRKNIAFGVAMALKESPMHNWPWLTCLLESVHLSCTRLISVPIKYSGLINFTQIYVNTRQDASVSIFNFVSLALLLLLLKARFWLLAIAYIALPPLGVWIFASTFLRAIYLEKFIEMLLPFAVSKEMQAIFLWW